MDKRPLPYSFIINHKSAVEITKRLTFLGYSAEKISEAKKLRRRHKLSLYGCSFKKRWGYADIQELKKLRLQLNEEKKALLVEIELYKSALMLCFVANLKIRCYSSTLKSYISHGHLSNGIFHDMRAILFLIFFTTIFTQSNSIRFVTRPRDVHVYNSNDTTFTCVAESDLSIVYTWLKDWREAQNNRWQPNGSKLYYNSVKLKDNNIVVVCRATDSQGVTIEATAVLYVYPKEDATHPAITTGPTDVEPSALSDVNFTCSAYGVMGDIRWIHDELELKTIQDLRVVTTTNDGLNIQSTLTLFEVDSENNGVYACEAFGTPVYVRGSDSRDATLTVTQAPESISIPPPLFPIEGEEMIAKCVFAGYPEPYVTWIDSEGVIVNTGSSWTVDNVTMDLDGTYKCVGRNFFGITHSGNIFITVYSVPRITNVFRELLELDFEDDLQLECNATGVPQPEIHWYFGATQLMEDSRTTIQSNYLHIYEVERQDEGSYYCTAVNIAGNVTSDTTHVKIHTAPVPPSGLEIDEITHNSAKLHWIPVQSTIPVFQFKVIVMDSNYLFLLPNTSIPIDSLSTVNGLIEYTLHGLSAYTVYRIWIQAINEIGESGFSRFEVFETETWLPSPPILHTRNITPTSVDIEIISDMSMLNGPYEGVNLTITSQESILTSMKVLNSSSQLKLYITQYNLLPYHTYTITAHTHNGDYYSDSSIPVTILTLQTIPGTPPRNLQVDCVSPSVCILHWAPPTEPNGVITSYTLVIENLQDTESRVSSFAVSNNSSSYIAENLTPFSSYSWRILASTNAGAGPQTTRGFRTPEGVPSSSPPLSVQTVNSTAVRVTWLALQASKLNGVFHHYQILYTKIGINGRILNSTLIIPSVQGITTLISNLIPNTDYGFSIRVNAGIGYGPYSTNPIHRVTLSAVPDSSVENLTAISFTPNSIFLEWVSIPKHLTYADTAGYRIQVTTDGNWVVLDEISFPTNRYYVTDLQPNTLYQFRIQLFNLLGDGPFSEELDISTRQTIPLVPIVVGSIADSGLDISLEITPQNSSTGDITEYKIEINEIGRGLEVTIYIQPTSLHGTTLFTYKATKYFTFYKFRVSAETNVGFGDYAVYLIETGQAAPSTPPQGLVALPQTSTSVHLSWKPIPSRYLNGRLAGYQIRYNTDLHIDWVYLNLTESVSLLVTQLDKYTKYTFQVSGVTVVSGEFSSPASNRTLPDIPGLIASVHLVRADSNLLEIGWTPPVETNGIISQYRIKVLHEEINDLAIHTSSLNSISLRDLYPYTRYDIRVAATNQVDTGMYSKPFIFSTTEDTPSQPIITQVYPQGHQLTVHWETPYDPNGEIIDYNLTCHLHTLNSTFSSRVTVLHEYGLYFYSASCTQLIPNTEYFIQLSARNSFNTSWTSLLRRTDFLPPKLADDSITRPEMIRENTFTLPKFSPQFGNISFYLIVVLVYDPLTTTLDTLTTNQSIYLLLAYPLTSEYAKPQNYIAANFTPSEYGEFSLGDNEVYGKYRNIPLKEGFGFTFYVKACVNSITPNEFLATSSSLSESIIVTRETPNNEQVKAISAVIAVSTLILIILICLFILLVTVYCARFRNKQNIQKSASISKQHIPYQPCDSEFNTVPWSANLNFKKVPKGTDPISNYRAAANDPHLDARQPVPAFMLPKILQDLTADEDLRLSEEYSYLVPIESSTTTIANAEINARKNRYLNILPYDHNRVCIAPNARNDSDYINASYIDSADRRNAYIATQGPTECTLEDFWQMVYEQHIQSIVMITKLKEKGADKCIQYWPTKETNIFGKYKVTLISASIYCDYIVRKILLGNATTNKESRIIYHFQFISWPDHGVPSHPLPMLNFLKTVHLTMYRKLNPTNHPILVHCSAGVGRTGTFIVLDSMLNRMLNEKDIDVFGHVAYLRTQRMFMVQGKDQYLFIYRVLAEYHTSLKTVIPLGYVDNVCTNLGQLATSNQMSGFELEFNLLKRDYEQKDFTSANNEINKQKNRYTRILPYEDTRVTLPILNEQLETDYINASFIDGITQKQQFIATQTPLASTIPDFWRMIWQQKSRIIVMITTQSSDFDECYFPEKLQIYDKFQVEKLSERANKDNYVYQQFSVMNLNSGEARIISHFQFSPFSQLNKSVSAKALLLLCQEIANMYQSIVTGPITVHCSNGSGNTGMLIAVMNLLEEMKESHQLNISQTVHYLRSQRPFMVQTIEQYLVIYEAILQHVNSQGNLSRRVSSIEEYTPPTSPMKMTTFSKARDSVSSWSSMQNRLSYPNNYRSSLISATSAYSNHEEVLELSS